MIRLIELGSVSPLISQAAYHGLAEVIDAETPDTIVFCSPAAPYFCVGYHQNAEDVLDLPRCQRRGWPVLRRKIGGGAVYLDQNQVFYQVIMHRSRAPWSVERAYATYLAGPLLALRRLGLDAALSGVNELEVGGRRIAGTGGGQLGAGVVVVGNLLMAFPPATMARAWRVPSVPFRRLAEDGMRRYMTTLRRELAEPPSPRALIDLLATCYAETLGRPLVPGVLTPREQAAVEAAAAELGSAAFVLERCERPARGLKITRRVSVYHGRAHAGDRALNVTVRLRDGHIDALDVRGLGADSASGRLRGHVLTDVVDPDHGNPAERIADLLAEGRPAERRLAETRQQELGRA